jgi:hypothetical protein
MIRAVRAATLAVIALALVAVAGAAAAVAKPRPLKVVGTNGKPLGGPYESWARHARVPTVTGRLRVLVTGCPRRPLLLGCIYSNRSRTLYLHPRARRSRSIFFHELGHLFDLRVMGRRDRRAFKRLMGRRGRWYRGVRPPSELFAEAYSLCARRSRIPRRVRGYYGFAATPRRHRSACRLIRRAAGPQTPPRRPRNPPKVPGPTQPAPPPSSPPPGEPPPEDESPLDPIADLLPG